MPAEFTGSNLQRRAGLTLSETLVVIAIVATLTGLSLSGVQRLRATSDRTKCANNLRQIVLAAQQYHTDRGRLPSGSFNLYEHVSWRGPLLPYLEQGALWQTAKDQLGAEMYFGDPKFLAGHTVVSAFICPSDSAAQAVQIRGDISFVESNYFGNSGISRYHETIPKGQPAGVIFEKSRIAFSDISDGTSNTLLAGERPVIDGRSSEWYLHASVGTAFLGVEEDTKGDDFERKICKAKIQFEPVRSTPLLVISPVRANFLFCDGSVRLIAYTARSILPALATRAGGDAATFPD